MEVGAMQSIKILVWK